MNSRQHKSHDVNTTVEIREEKGESEFVTVLN